MIQFKCDGCGKATRMNPPSEPVLDENGQPKFIEREVQNPATGQLVTTRIPEIKYLEEKCYLVSLKVGDVKVQRDFCEECLLKIKPRLKEVMTLLKEVKPQ